MIHGVFPELVHSPALGRVFPARGGRRKTRESEGEGDPGGLQQRARATGVSAVVIVARMCGNIETLLHSAPAVIQRLAGRNGNAPL